MELKQYIKPLLRWWWLILLSTTIAAIGSYVATNQQPRTYQTSTTLMIGQVLQRTEVSGMDLSVAEQLAESYAQIATRQPVLQATVESLGLKTSWQELKKQIEVFTIPRTQLLSIRVSDTVPERTVAIADEIALQLIRQSPRAPQNEAREERSVFIGHQLDDLEGRIKKAQTRVKELEAELDAALSARQIQDLQTEITNLQALIKDWEANYAELLAFLEGGEGPNFLTVIEPAPSAYIVGPRVMVNVLLAAAIGFILAAGAAFLLDYIDDTLKSPDELSESLGLTPLGAIEQSKGINYKDRLITTEHLLSPMAETYRMLRGNIQFINIDKPIKSVLVTSSMPKEGKSVTASNLGIIMAQTELRTIIIDADLRRPVLHKFFDVPNSIGLSDLICSPDLEIRSLLRPTHVENLQIVTSGSLPPNPAELLGSRRMAQLLDQFKEMADFIIIDSPGVLVTSDALGFANRVDGVLLVTQSGRTRIGNAKQAIQNLQQVGANILGGVINQVSARRRGYSYSRSDQNNVRNQLRWQQRWLRRLPFYKKPGQTNQRLPKSRL